MNLCTSAAVRGARLCALTAAVCLTACGGGSGDEPAAAPGPSSGSPSAPEPVTQADSASAPAYSVAGTRATCDIADFEARVMAAVNARRARGADCGGDAYPAVTDLRWNAALALASLVHSDDMAANNFFSHEGSDGSNAGHRATSAGFVWKSWGENIAAGQVGVDAVVAAWMASPGHCANIMNGSFRDVGLACVAGGSGNKYRTYWTMVLGTAR